MNNIEKQIEKIEERNEKVECDKAWEVSKTRKMIIAVLTYLVIVLFFYIVDFEKPFIGAIVPTLGFLLSTFSLQLFKNIWLKYIYNK